MKRTFISLVLLLSFALVAVAQERGKESQGEDLPKLSIDSLTHDFGEVKSGSSLSYSFKVKNKGKADLIIKAVKPG